MNIQGASYGANPKLPRIIITGGAGFIGSHLTDFLLKKGFQVLVIDDLSTGDTSNLAMAFEYPSFSFFQNKVQYFPWQTSLIASDIVVHLAATVGVKKVTESTTCTLTNNHSMCKCILDAIKPNNNRLIYASTSEVYGNSPELGSKEADPLSVHVQYGGRSAYTLSKLYGEMCLLAAAAESNTPITILRLFNTIGPRQKDEYGMVVPRFIQQALEGKDLTVFDDGLQTRSFCSVFDIVEAIYAMLRNKKSFGEIYNIGNPKEITIAQLAKFVVETCQSKSSIKYHPLPEGRKGDADIRYRKPSIQKIKEDLAWEPKESWQSAILMIIKNKKMLANEY